MVVSTKITFYNYQTLKVTYITWSAACSISWWGIYSLTNAGSSCAVQIGTCLVLFNTETLPLISK